MTLDPTNPDPLYIQISKDILDRVRTKQLRPGESVGSHNDLSSRYGVSLITVKKALSKLISDGVLYSRVGSGTYVADQSMNTSHTRGKNEKAQKTIGLILSDIANPFFSLVMKGAEKVISQHKYSLLISSGLPNTSSESKLDYYRDMGIDGLIIASLDHTYKPGELVQECEDEAFPYIMVSYVSDDEINFVGSDHLKGAYIATEHLLKMGYASVGYVNARPSNAVGALRLQGYQQALLDYDLSFKDQMIVNLTEDQADKYFAEGRRVGLDLLKTGELPEALFVYNDLSALGLIEALLSKGVRVPDDVAIVGFDDIERAAYAPVPLTTVKQRKDEIGAKAARIIVNNLDSGAPIPVKTILEPELIVRSSCGSYPLLLKNGFAALANR